MSNTQNQPDTWLIACGKVFFFLWRSHSIVYKCTNALMYFASHPHWHFWGLFPINWGFLKKFKHGVSALKEASCYTRKNHPASIPMTSALANSPYCTATLAAHPQFWDFTRQYLLARFHCSMIVYRGLKLSQLLKIGFYSNKFLQIRPVFTSFF